jgi:hypothetical protein
VWKNPPWISMRQFAMLTYKSEPRRSKNSSLDSSHFIRQHNQRLTSPQLLLAKLGS